MSRKSLYGLLIAFFAALFAPPGAFAQFTQVTGTITDPNGIPYDCGTISAQLVVPGGTAPTLSGAGFTTQTSPVQLGCSLITGTGAPGSFLMRLADNNVILPSGTQWNFTVNMSPGVPPPAGTGPQSFTSTQTITGATQTVAFGGVPALTRGAGGVSGIVIPTLTRANYVPDATATNGSAIVTCPNADCKFLSTAAVGNLVKVTNMTSDISELTSVKLFPAGTTIASIQSDTQITLSNTANGGVSCTAACVLVWGVDQGAAIDAAWTKAINACQNLTLPGGYYITQRGTFNANNAACRMAQGVFNAAGVSGQGPSLTNIVPLDLDPTTCTGGPGGNACFFAAQGITVQNLQVYGAGESVLPAGFNGKIGVQFDASTQCCGNYQATNVRLSAYGAATPGFTGEKMSGASNASFLNVHNDGMGSIGCQITTNTGVANGYTLVGQYCANNLNKSLLIDNTGGGNPTVFDYNGVYGNQGNAVGGIAVHVLAAAGAAAEFRGFGTIVRYGSTSTGHNEALAEGNTGTATFTCNGCLIVQPNTDAGSNALAATSTAPGNGQVIFSNSQIINSSIGTAINVFTTRDSATDACGNRVTGNITNNTTTGIFLTCPSSTYTSIANLAPSCSANCGTGPSVSGSNERMVVTIGTAPPVASTFTITFKGTWSSAPQCTGLRGTTGISPVIAGIVTTTTTGVVNLSANLVASEKYNISCSLVQ